jgi:hypothetical protein
MCVTPRGRRRDSSDERRGDEGSHAVTVGGDAPEVDVAEARQDGDCRVRAKRVRRARTLLEQPPRGAKGRPAGVSVIDRDTDQPPRANHVSERAAIRLGVAAGGVAEHDRREWSGAARLQQDALEIDGRTVQRADERPRRPGRRLGIAGDRERRVVGRARRHSLRRPWMTCRQRTQQGGDQGGPEHARHDPWTTARTAHAVA